MSTKFISNEEIFPHLKGNLPVVKTLDDLIKKLHQLFESDTVNIEEVCFLMKAYKSNRQDWEKYAIFDNKKYTRNLVDIGNGRFNLIALCWGKGQGAPVHDHAKSQCVMKMLQGSLEETRYAYPKTETELLRVMSNKQLNVDEVAFISDNIGLHSVKNPFDEDAVSLHLYCPPFAKCNAFLEKTGKCCEVPMTFTSKFGCKQ